MIHRFFENADLYMEEAMIILFLETQQFPSLATRVDLVFVYLVYSFLALIVKLFRNICYQ